MKPVLLIIDMSKDLFSQNYHNGILLKNKNKIVSCINTLVSIFRENKLPIIWVAERLKSDLSDAPLMMKKTKRFYTLDNTDGWKILDELDYKKEDTLIIKKRYSAFFETDLDKMLKKLKADTLIVTGVNTHACIRMAAIDAYERDYEVILPIDGIDSWDKEHEKISLKYMDGGIVQVKSTDEIKQMIASA